MAEKFDQNQANQIFVFASTSNFTIEHIKPESINILSWLIFNTKNQLKPLPQQ